MRRALLTLAAAGVLASPIAAQRVDVREVVANYLPGFKLAEARDYANGQTPQISLKDEGGQVVIQRDFDADGRSDWAAIAIDRTKRLGQACLIMNLGSSYNVKILREWKWDEDYYTFHLREADKATAEQKSEARFAPLVADKALTSFTPAERKALADKIKRYASDPSVNLVHYLRCLGCDLFGGDEYFFDTAGKLQKLSWVH